MTHDARRPAPPTLRAVYFGRLGRAAGLESVLHAMVLLRSEYPRLELHVVGRAGDEDDGVRYWWCMEALTDDLGLAGRVTFLDRDPGPGDVSAFATGADVLITRTGPDRLWIGRSSVRPGVASGGTLVRWDHDEGVADAIHVALDPRAARVVI